MGLAEVGNHQSRVTSRVNPCLPGRLCRTSQIWRSPWLAKREHSVREETRVHLLIFIRTSSKLTNPTFTSPASFSLALRLIIIRHGSHQSVRWPIEPSFNWPSRPYSGFVDQPYYDRLASPAKASRRVGPSRPSGPPEHNPERPLLTGPPPKTRHTATEVLRWNPCDPPPFEPDGLVYRFPLNAVEYSKLADQLETNGQDKV